MAVAAPACAGPPVHLVTGSDRPPFADRGLPGGGLATALIRGVYDNLDRDVKIAFLPWRRGYRATLAGRFDGAFPYARNARRFRAFAYSDPLIRTTRRPMVDAGSDFDAGTPRDLAGLTYCLPNGREPQGAIRRMTGTGALRRLEPPSMAGCLHSLTRGFADFVPVSELRGRAQAQRVLRDRGAVRFLSLVIAHNTYHVMFPRRNTDAERLRDRFNTGLARLQASGRYAAIVERHLERVLGPLARRAD